MRRHLLALFLLALASGCASRAPLSSPPVASWQTVDPAAMNAKIDQARTNGQPWADQVERYVFNLIPLHEVRSFSYELSYDRVEQPQLIEITLVRDGFLDDAVRGDMHRIDLHRPDKRNWRIREVKKAYRCWRRPRPEYSNQPCP